MIERCATCGDPIGDRQAKNAIYWCDVLEGAWCGDCFGAVQCEELHGEGCATLSICVAQAKDTAPEVAPESENG